MPAPTDPRLPSKFGTPLHDVSRTSRALRKQEVRAAESGGLPKPVWLWNRSRSMWRQTELVVRRKWLGQTNATHSLPRERQGPAGPHRLSTTIPRIIKESAVAKVGCCHALTGCAIRHDSTLMTSGTAPTGNGKTLQTCSMYYIIVGIGRVTNLFQEAYRKGP